jgi:cytochrome c biogenesis protein CcmG, thiol:disulfide interchange protein DsbE
MGELMEGRQRIDRRWMTVFLVAAALLGAARWFVPHQSAGLTAINAREPMAALVMPGLDGGQWKLADHRGEVVLLNYWATWCEPCRDELPTLLQTTRESEAKGLVVVGVSFDTGGDAQVKVRQFVRRYGVPYAIVFPDAGLSAESRDIALPTTVLIDRHGRRAKTYAGELERTALTKDIAALLAER